MDQQPLTFGDLASCLAPVPQQRVRCWGPIIASIVPHSHGDHSQRGSDRKTLKKPNPAWAILHSISDWNARLIHAEPLEQRQYDVEITSPGGETLRFVLSVGRSKKAGELYETVAEVVHSGWSSFPYPIAS